MFKRAFQSAIRFQKCTKSMPKTAIFCGTTTTSMGIAFFAKKDEEKTGKNAEIASDPKMPKNFNLIVTNADELYDNYLIENCYNILKKFESSECSELLWRLARVTCELSKLSKDANEKKRLMLDAFRIVKRAVEHEPSTGCFGAHKWYGILLDYVGEIEGNKSRIEKAFQVREHLERALQIYENDPTTWHILGLWHYSFANMGYATRMVAKAIFATPPTSTYQEALHYFLKAEQISPGFYSTNTYYIGEVYEQLGDKDAALSNYKMAFRMPVITSDDAGIHKKAHEKLRKFGVKETEMV